MKTCPCCEEKIDSIFDRCPYCGEILAFLPDDEDEEKKPAAKAPAGRAETSGMGLPGIIIIVILLLFLSLHACNRDRAEIKAAETAAETVITAEPSGDGN